MSDSIIVAILSLIGTALGAVVSVLTANRLTIYKIDERRKVVEKHNGLIDRTYKLEKDVTIVNEKMDVLDHRVDALERK
ncbi:MAG: hypothetical protein J6112_02740 [Clostridia bacterium]|nr:hypothetical protein [Clostridia bacterium]